MKSAVDQRGAPALRQGAGVLSRRLILPYAGDPRKDARVAVDLQPMAPVASVVTIQVNWPHCGCQSQSVGRSSTSAARRISRGAHTGVNGGMPSVFI